MATISIKLRGSLCTKLLKNKKTLRKIIQFHKIIFTSLPNNKSIIQLTINKIQIENFVSFSLRKTVSLQHQKKKKKTDQTNLADIFSLTTVGAEPEYKIIVNTTSSTIYNHQSNFTSTVPLYK